ncbi:MAG: HAD family phosphatase [Thermoplasmata archaeon]
MTIRFVAFDMDGTLVNVESSFASVHAHFGETNTEALALFLNDQINDEEFIRRDIRIWKKHAPDLRVQDLEEILASVPLMPGALSLMKSLHARGIATAIVSGGIDILAKRVGRELGIGYVLANGFRVDAAGRLTGEGIIRVPVKHKEEVLARIQEQLGFTPEESAAVGNSEIDVGMFRRCRVGIAFLPADQSVIDGASHVVREPDLEKILPHLLPSSASAT